METKLKILGFAGSLKYVPITKPFYARPQNLLPDDTTLEIFDLDGIPPFNQDLEIGIIYSVAASDFVYY